MVTRPRVLITEPITEVGIKLLEPSCDLFTPWREKRAFNEEELASADGLIVRLVPVDAALISRAPNLKVVGRHGVGLDSVDLAAASARGIAVVYTPRLNANSVAEHAVNLLLALARHTVRADAVTRANRFHLRGQLVGMELRHKVLGINLRCDLSPRLRAHFGGFSDSLLGAAEQPRARRQNCPQPPSTQMQSNKVMVN